MCIYSSVPSCERLGNFFQWIRHYPEYKIHVYCMFSGKRFRMCLYLDVHFLCIFIRLSTFVHVSRYLNLCTEWNCWIWIMTNPPDKIIWHYKWVSKTCMFTSMLSFKKMNKVFEWFLEMLLKILIHAFTDLWHHQGKHQMYNIMLSFPNSGLNIIPVLQEWRPFVCHINLL